MAFSTSNLISKKDFIELINNGGISIFDNVWKALVNSDKLKDGKGSKIISKFIFVELILTLLVLH